MVFIITKISNLIDFKNNLFTKKKSFDELYFSKIKRYNSHVTKPRKNLNNSTNQNATKRVTKSQESIDSNQNMCIDETQISENAFATSNSYNHVKINFISKKNNPKYNFLSENQINSNFLNNIQENEKKIIFKSRNYLSKKSSCNLVIYIFLIFIAKLNKNIKKTESIAEDVDELSLNDSFFQQSHNNLLTSIRNYNESDKNFSNNES